MPTARAYLSTSLFQVLIQPSASLKLRFPSAFTTIPFPDYVWIDVLLSESAQ